ncbi:hypothetical protein VTN77DRAFT_9449 [Rasamsonia byssochlamydoides]|uniref:uncharacterized protein n=1 Tax=Rasamsonia byssochlamydoides TaxID=89139 RepID=UPI003743507C
MDSMEASTHRKVLKQACDNCRRRKIKCNRAYPCDKCQRLLLSCSYSDVLQRKGPKFRTLYPLAPLHPLSAQYQAPQSGNHACQGNKHQFPDGCRTGFSWNPTYESYSSPDSIDSHSQYELSSYRVFPRRRLSSLVLLAHVNVYLKYLYPIMPVIRPDQVLNDSREPEKLTPQRYAFMAALCAATHVQLKLDGAAAMTDASLGHGLSDGRSAMSGEELLAEAVSARKECDISENIDIETLLTSFFLFAAYGNLDKQDQAWFYLSQSTAMAHTLGLHRESTYSNFNPTEAEERRRVFWLLFVTERAYALQQAKPVMLRSSIHKPKVLYSEDPILEYGFLNLINIFEKLTPDLYDWVSVGCDDSISGVPPTGSIRNQVCKPISLEGVLEIQQVDILVTQQWLQAMMWKLSMSGSPHPTSTDTLLPFHLPVLVGKAVMDVLGSVSQSAIDAHGIGMEQKLYDVGTSIADVTRSLRSTATQRLTASIADPKDLLWGILNILSRIRGSQSYLFPALLQRSSSVFGLDSPATLTNSLSFADDSPSSWGVKEAGSLESLAASGQLDEDREDRDDDNSLRRIPPDIPPLVDSLYLA